MKPETPLDYAVFQLTPTRTRCELLVWAGDEVEKLAAGLIQPFLSHIREANDQIVKGGCSIKLEPPADGDGLSPWFTKGTLERFVRFVSTPEVLERVCSVEDELVQLEETYKKNDNAAIDELQPGTPSSQSADSPGESNGQSNLLKALEARRTTLYKEQSLAFARAVAAGFVAENMASLIQFAVFFGATRLQDASEKYLQLCKRRREKEIWVEEASSPVPEPNVEAEHLDDSSDVPCSNALENGASNLSMGTNTKDGDGAGEMLSFREKISMFEGKKTVRDAEKRRMSAEVSRTETQKPVLRRWSLAVEKVGLSPQVQKKEKAKQLHEDVEENTEEELSASSGNGSSALTAEQATALEAFWKNADGAHQRQEDQKSVSSETHSLKNSKGRFYEQYREKRDAKLREEGSSQKAEKQARLVAMQETLERRRAEVAKSLRLKKNDPLAEARIRAEKLRAFKAGLAETKKAKEEEERRRLEELRVQRQQKKVAAPGSPHSAASPRQVSMPGRSSARGLFPTFQRSSSIGTRAAATTGVGAGGSNRVRRSWNVVSQSVPSFPDLKQQQQQQQENDYLRPRSATGMKSGKVNTKNSSNSSKVLRNAVLRKSVSCLEGSEGLKCLGAAVEEDVVVIRAPVTIAEDEADDDNGKVAAKIEQESSGGEGEGYEAPVAPISVSPMLVST